MKTPATKRRRIDQVVPAHETLTRVEPSSTAPSQGGIPSARRSASLLNVEMKDRGSPVARQSRTPQVADREIPASPTPSRGSGNTEDDAIYVPSGTDSSSSRSPNDFRTPMSPSNMPGADSVDAVRKSLDRTSINRHSSTPGHPQLKIKSSSTPMSVIQRPESALALDAYVADSQATTQHDDC